MDRIRLHHNSHAAFYRSPFGAALCNQAITLRITVAANIADIHAQLCLWADDDIKYFSMSLSEETAKHRVYECVIKTPADPCLLWYYFILQTAEGPVYYGNNEQQAGGAGQTYQVPPPAYQITVYQDGASAPEWFTRGIVYQIFVDRFYNGLPDGQILNPKKGSLIHPHWDDDPIYVRDRETGRILAYDFFGGNLAGVQAKLDYLEELGVSAIYLNPIFESPSNHKYDTADYKSVDAMFGTLDTFRSLCAEAARRGISIILDGVFSHTGSDSIYFNKQGRYPVVGAFQSVESPYYDWYRFRNYPHEYDSWWGIDTMPNVNELEPSYLDFAVRSRDSVVRYWLDQGAKGWRLDVADELPDGFIKELRTAVKSTDPSAVIIGEVWEDASHKLSYGSLRQYLGGDELDSVTNYPFQSAVLDFILGRIDAARVDQVLMSLYENYPRNSFYSALNLLGSHDVPRVLTALQAEVLPGLDAGQIAKLRLKLAAVWQMTFPGVPCIYYGDEAGLTGGADPENRRTFPWGREDSELLGWYRKITAIRRQYAVLQSGDWHSLVWHPDVYGYIRETPENTAIILLNRSLQEIHVNLDNPLCRGLFYSVLAGDTEVVFGGGTVVRLAPLEPKLFVRQVEVGSRDCGILLHLTSLPGPHGIGDMGESACRFIDFLQAGRQKYWQMLPLNPPGKGDSPYNAFSAFAGNPLLIAPDLLIKEGLLSVEELSAVRIRLGIDQLPADKVNFAAVKQYKEVLLRIAFKKFSQNSGNGEIIRFRENNSFWITDFARFMALKNHFQDQPWVEWPAEVRAREPKALDHYAELLKEEIDYHTFVQFQFWQQWAQLADYAHDKGVRIIGDLPIFIAYDSCDVWSYPQLFDLDAVGRPQSVAGVPPDYFSETGQLWGNPLYRWQEASKDDYRWWRERLSLLLKQMDVVRVDHFRGFEAFWAIDAQAETAREGAWVKGPGHSFFRVLERYLGKLPIIAEDLGMITPEVAELREAVGYPGMKVLQFAFGYSADGGLAPIGCEYNSVVYPGTHDNNTTLGWYRHIAQTDPGTMNCLKQYLGVIDEVPEQEIVWRINELAYQCKSRTAIVALQDTLILGEEARMNKPGTVDEDNWSWRCLPTHLGQNLSDKLAALAVKYGRG